MENKLTPELERIIQEGKDESEIFKKFDELGVDFDDWIGIIYEYKQKYPPSNLGNEEGITILGL